MSEVIDTQKSGAKCLRMQQHVTGFQAIDLWQLR